MDSVDVVVVGAGAVGLAIARELAMDGQDVLVVERNASFGMETSSRNNEVVHSGVFHRPGSPQAALCRRGRDMIYAYCAARGVRTERTGKLILANSETDRDWLAGVFELGLENDCDDLEWLEGEEVLRLEPEITCHSAILSPSTGIMDTHNLMLAFLGDAEAAGALVAFRSEVTDVEPVAGGFKITVVGHSGERIDLRCRTLVNAAGPWSAEVARKIRGLPASALPKVHFAKGTFFKYHGARPFSRLVVPSQPSWRNGGIFTLDLGGQGKFGPDEEWVDAVDYKLDQSRAAAVAEAIRRYWPSVRADALIAEYAGVRPRLNGPGEPPANWLLQGPDLNGLNGLINLFGVESPGVTSSLAIASEVAQMVQGAPSPFAPAAGPAGENAGSTIHQ